MQESFIRKIYDFVNLYVRFTMQRNIEVANVDVKICTIFVKKLTENKYEVTSRKELPWSM